MHLLTVVGARPQFVKAAALERAMAEDPGRCRHTLVHTGQHYDEAMSDRFFDELGLPVPAHHLEVGSAPHGVQTGRIMERLEPVLAAEAPDAVVVYGDTNSTLAAALVATKLGLRLAHVEAGLRSFRRDMPEEVNRVVTDHVADDCFCPSQTSVDNLRAEGIVDGVHLVGDVMFDVLRWQLAQGSAEATLDRFGLEAGRFVLATVHRAANTDDPDRMQALLDGLLGVAAAGIDVLFPVHPRTQARGASSAVDHPRLRMVEPIGHRDCLHLASRAHAVVTDSGGLQKEAYWLGTPCVTLREETEWPETVAAGWNRLVGADAAAIVAAVTAGRPPGEPPAIYGDGTASRRVLAALLS